MKNFKIGDLVLLKNGDKSEIFSVLEKYKESLQSQEYIYGLITLDRKVLDEEYSALDLVKYDLCISNEELNERLSFNYKNEILGLENYSLLINNFKEEQIELINQIVDKYAYDCAYSSNILDVINEYAVKNNQTMIEFTSKYVPYILNTIENLRLKNTNLSIESIINNGLMMHIYNTMKENKRILYKRMLLNRIIWELECIEEVDIFGYINNINYYIGDNVNVLLILNSKDILLYMEEYLEEIMDIPFNEINKIKNKIEGFYYFLEEKIK